VTFLIGLSFRGVDDQSRQRPVADAGDGNVLSDLLFLADCAAGGAGTHDAVVRAGKILVATFETLMTTPVSDLQVVAAKFASALVFYIVMWLPMLACLFVRATFHKSNECFGRGHGRRKCIWACFLVLQRHRRYDVRLAPGDAFCAFPKTFLYYYLYIKYKKKINKKNII